MTTPKNFKGPYPVMALRKGHYDYIRDEGEIFLIRDKSDFSKKWMKKMPLNTKPSRHIEEYAVDPRLTMTPKDDPATHYEHNLQLEDQPGWE